MIPDFMHYTNESREFLYLLTTLLRHFTKRRDIDADTIDELVNTDPNAEGFGETEREQLLDRYCRLPKQTSLNAIFTDPQDLEAAKRTRDILSAMIDYTPQETTDNPFEDIIAAFVGNPKHYRNVPLNRFRPELFTMSWRFGSPEELPETIDILEPNHGTSISNFYFAAMQLVNGFAPNIADRATENMFNIAFVDGAIAEEFGIYWTLAMNMRNLSMEGPMQEPIRPQPSLRRRFHYSPNPEYSFDPMGFVTRLPSEYLKAMLYYGNIVTTDIETFDFFDMFIERFKERHDDIYEMVRRNTPHIGDVHDFAQILSDDPIEFIGQIKSENMDPFLRYFDAKEYSDIVYLILHRMVNEPMIYRLNCTHVADSEEYFRTAEFIVESGKEIARVMTPENAKTLQRIQEYIFDNRHRILCDPDRTQNPELADVNGSRPGHYIYLFRALKEHSAKRRTSFDRNHADESDRLKNYVEAGTRIADALGEDSIMFLEDIIQDNYARLLPVTDDLAKVFSDRRFAEKFCGYALTAGNRLELLEFFSNFADHSAHLVELIRQGTIEMDQVDGYIQILKEHSIAPTPYLIESLALSDDPDPLVSDWTTTLHEKFNDEFSPDKELHLNLGYTQFSALLGNSLLTRNQSKKFQFTWNFASYLKLISDSFPDDTSGPPFEPEDPDGEDFLRYDHDAHQEQHRLFEVSCAAYESFRLMQFIQDVKSKADDLGKELLVVPNFRYGFIPLIPLYDELLEMGAKIFMGAKIGSSAAHTNPSVLDSELLRGLEGYILDEQPIIMVIDGTQSLGNNDHPKQEPKYPDSYQGYLNYAIALNDLIERALEKDPESGAERCYRATSRNSRDYIAKDEELMADLTRSFEYAEFMDAHKGKARASDGYQFKFWNTAGMKLCVHQRRQKVATPGIVDVDEITRSAMIFCNVGLTHEQLPSTITDSCPRYFRHVPAFFDDTEEIINLELRATRSGVVVYNRIESLLRKAYCEHAGRSRFSEQSALVGDHPNHVDKSPDRPLF